MRFLVIFAHIIATFVSTLSSTQAKPADLSQWFLDATAWDAPGTSAAIATPDFLGGKRQIGDRAVQSLCNVDYGAGLPSIYALWSLLAYDRKHHIGLAAPDDADGCALFQAHTPAEPSPMQTCRASRAQVRCASAAPTRKSFPYMGRR